LPSHASVTQVVNPINFQKLIAQSRKEDSQSGIFLGKNAKD
jgi:hypothetical protein